MTEALEQFFVNNFSDTIWLAILLFSMLPITEARLAIPFGLSVALWGGNVAHPWIIFLCAYIGSTLPTIFIIPLLKPMFAWLKKTKIFNKIIVFFEKRFSSKANALDDNQKTFSKALAITLFVAIPLPLTGVWMGSGISAFSKLKWWQGMLSVAIGNLIACTILMLISLVFGNSVAVLLIVFAIFIVLYALTMLILMIVKKRQNQQKLDRLV